MAATRGARGAREAAAGREPVTSEFRAALERDRRLGLLPDPAIADWRYIRRTRHDLDHPLVFEYRGPEDLVHWIADCFARLDQGSLEGSGTRAFWQAQPSYIPHYEHLLARSAAAHRRLFDGLERVEYDPELHHPQDVYNVQDFHYCTSLASGIRTVLDFGAGYGRQAFLFATMLDGARYLAVDAVEQPYMVQRWVFDRLGLARWDYVDDPAPERTSVEEAFGGAPGVFHLPAWRLDLLRDGSVDLILFVWSLYEMSGAAAQAAVAACRRLVRIGGYVYIRDAPHSVSYRFDPERRLEAAGFALVYASRTISGGELHGRQRLYRRTRQDVGVLRRALDPLRPRVRRFRTTHEALAWGRRQRRERR
jgi:SAM-dependent methyltransferase